MSPGQISNLSLSDEVAFRVRFLGEKPDPRQLYWRGPVLWTTDGRTWRARRSGRSLQPMYAELMGRPLDYEVTIEPHDRNWLFGLDVPASVPQKAGFLLMGLLDRSTAFAELERRYRALRAEQAPGLPDWPVEPRVGPLPVAPEPVSGTRGR